MRHFREGSHAALDRWLVALRDGLGADVPPLASTPVDLRVFIPRDRWAHGPRFASAPRAINDLPPLH